MRKTATFLQVINKPITYKFFKDFTNHRKNTNRAIAQCPPLLNYWGETFSFSQIFLRGVGNFFYFKGRSPYEELAKIGCERGDSTFKNLIVYLFFHFLNLARFYSCTILTVLSYIFIRIPDFGLGTTIMLSCRYLP